MAAAGCIGLINSIGSLGGFLGPTVLGHLQARSQSGSFDGGIYFLCACMAVAAAIILSLGVGRKATGHSGP